MTIFFLCPSRLLFLGLAGKMEVFEQPRWLRSPPCLAPGSDPRISHSADIQSCRFACYDEKEVFNQNVNYLVTKIKLIAAVYRGPAFKARVLCPLGKPVSF